MIVQTCALQDNTLRLDPCNMIANHVMGDYCMDEEFELDEQTQAIIEAIGAAIEAENAEPQVLDIPRLLQVIRAYQLLRAIAWESWKISYSLHEPYTSMGVITVEAAEFTFDQMAQLHQILAHASNVEIFPLINGDLRMNITFHGITKRV